MGKVNLWVDGTQIEAEEGQSVLRAALAAGIYNSGLLKNRKYLGSLIKSFLAVLHKGVKNVIQLIIFFGSGYCSLCCQT